MDKISYHLPPNAFFALLSLISTCSLVYPLPVCATTFPTYSIKLKRLQNKAIPIITKLLQNIEFFCIAVA